MEKQLPLLQKTKIDGEIIRDRIDFFYVSIAMAKREGIVNIENVRSIFGSAFPQLNFSCLQDIIFVGDATFILFADMASNNKYDYPSSKTCGNPTTSNECIEALSIKSNDGVRAIYYNEKSEGKKINSSGTLDILFRRPNPEPIFCIRNNPASTNCDTLGSIISMIIEISSLSNPDIYKTVTISNNGQISVSD